MLNFVFPKKRTSIPKAYRALNDRETVVVSGGGGELSNQLGGGSGMLKDPNG